ncbi:MAG: hypothetical protein A3C02_04195 [Candidatus Andersenbacteria bacterium RIFCSPHIGHO2_02_FULL_45_11]|nr:MAG: hypothetical protein A3C02_04195 [Candidatus Andersenbacteria bacterium RIFCSPHIGHO2_02_FULL_45_11]
MNSEKISPFEVEQELRRRKIVFFTLRDFSSIFSISGQQAKYFLETYTKKGVFIRLKKGLYSVHGTVSSEEEIANILYQPSYISFEYALARYNILPEMVYSITSATTKPTRTFEADGKTFSYVKIKTEAYRGYMPIKTGDNVILLADKEKALIDYLYFVSLGKKTLNDRLMLSDLHREKMLEYARLYNRPSLIRLVQSLV